MTEEKVEEKTDEVLDAFGFTRKRLKELETKYYTQANEKKDNGTHQIKDVLKDICDDPDSTVIEKLVVAFYLGNNLAIDQFVQDSEVKPKKDDGEKHAEKSLD